MVRTAARSMGRDVIVAGAGIGGLTAALALQRAGHRVRVFEKAASLGEVGAGVMLTPNATRVLRQLGLGATVATHGVVPRFTAVRDHASGRTLSQTEIGAASERRHGAPNYYIHRSDLHRILVEAVRGNDPDCITVGAGLLNLTEGQSGVTAHFAGGGVAEGEALIGADGIKSRVREIVAPDAATRFTGNVAWRGLVPAKRIRPELRQPESIIWVGPQRHVVCYGVRNGTLFNYVALAEQAAWQDEGWTVPARLADVIAEFAGWHPDIADIIRETPPETCFKWGLFDRPPLPRWSTDRVTLLGDAAHPMLPFLGQGAALAIEDGAALAYFLSRGEALGAALAAYQAGRRDRTIWVQAQARANQNLYHDRAAAARFAEDRELRARALYDYDANQPPELWAPPVGGAG